MKSDQGGENYKISTICSPFSIEEDRSMYHFEEPPKSVFLYFSEEGVQAGLLLMRKKIQVICLSYLYYMKSYKQFRSELKEAYPLSHGELRLPIATQLFDFPELNLESCFEEIGSSLQKLITQLDNPQLKRASIENNHEN